MIMLTPDNQLEACATIGTLFIFDKSISLSEKKTPLGLSAKY